MPKFSQVSRGRNDGINHMQGIYLNVYGSNSFVRPRISRWQSHLDLDEIPTTDEEAVALYTPQVLLDKDRIAVASGKSGRSAPCTALRTRMVWSISSVS
jgi:hypothetical protein